MIRVSIHLPRKLRLDINLVKKRKDDIEKPLLPNIGKIRRTRTGNKISRFFRHIFEHTKIKKLLGANLIFLALGTSILPTSHIDFSLADETTITPQVVLETQKGERYPLNNVKITQGYKFYHPGIDFDGITGDPVYPITTGVVSDTGYSRFGYGNHVIVNHGNGISSLYAHLSKINISKGQTVSIQTKIGEVGATGRAFGDHLHLEIYDNGKTINPLSILEN